MSLSEQTRLELLKYATQTVIDYYPGDETTHAQIEGFYLFLLRLASTGSHTDADPSPGSTSEGGLEFPPELVKCALDASQSFTAHLIDSLTLDLVPCADNSVAPGTTHFVGRAGFAPFVFNYQGTPTFPTRSFDLNIKTHSSSPNASEDARTDSTSGAGEKSVAPVDLASESLPTLHHLSKHAQNLALLRAATQELSKRRGDV